jgi:hypothetical protein
VDEEAGSAVMARPGPPRRRPFLPALVAVLVLAALVAAGLAVIRRSAGNPAALPGTAAPITNPATPVATTQEGPSPPPATVTVAVAAALRDNLYAAEVTALFERYFNAINRRDYQAWLSTLSVDHAPDPRSRFQLEYATTADDQVRIVGLDTGDNGLQVAVSFRSRQDPSLAPTDQPVACLNWQIEYSVVLEAGALKISFVKPTDRTYSPCVSS